MRRPAPKCLPITLLCAAIAATATAEAADGLPAPKRTVAVDGADIAYYEAGAPDGAPVVFVHGLPFSSYIWRDVVRALDDEGHRLIALDLVGFGDSSGTGHGVLEQADHLGAFIAALGLEDVVLVGHDWGAGVALVHAGADPDAVAGFATMEGAMPPVYPRPAYEEMPERIAGMFRAMRGPGAETNVLEENLWLDTILPTMSAAPLPDAVVAEYRRPFPTPASREPILAMSRSLPIGGEPADVVAAYERGVDWWTSSDAPKLVVYAEPGRLYGPELTAWNAEARLRVHLVDEAPLRTRLLDDLDRVEAITESALDVERALAEEPLVPVDLNALVEEVAAELRVPTGRLSRSGGNGTVHALCRPVMLRRSVTNLVDNTIGRGGGVAELSVRHEAAGEIAVRVRDRGKGIDASRLDGAFEPFRRLEGSRSRATGGTGLGLTLARSVARRHGGDVTLAPAADGPGLVATLRFPDG